MKLFLQKTRNNVGAETYNVDLDNQNHCKKNQIFASLTLAKYILQN